MNHENRFRTEFRLRLDRPSEADLYQKLKNRDIEKYKTVNDCLKAGLMLLFEERCELDPEEFRTILREELDLFAQAALRSKKNEGQNEKQDEGILDFLSDL